MIISRRERDEAYAILGRMMTALLSGLSSSGKQGADLRRSVGNLLADVVELSKAGTMGETLLSCFDKARLAGATLDNMDTVRLAMLDEEPQYAFGSLLVASGIVFSAVEQCQLIALMTFASRRSVDVLMLRMVDIFETIKLEMADLLDSQNYQLTVSLSAALMQHLAATERKLPRIVTYTMRATLPSLVLANMFYGDASRSEEIIAENQIVHPAFCKRDLVALSE